MVRKTKRKAAVAGSFYPRYKPDLLKVLNESFENSKFGPGEKCKSQNKDKRTVFGGLSPHAGYTYSGCAAAHTYLNLFREKIPDTVVIIGTDHQGYSDIGLMKEGIWKTPLGGIEIDRDLAEKILEKSPKIKEDESAFIGFPYGREHNIEVQLPFIKHCAGEKDLELVPIKMGVKDYETLVQISDVISSAISEINKDIIIVASSDMTHKRPANMHDPADDLKDMKEKDQAVIDAFLQFDPEKVYKAARNTTVCGPQTITTLMLTCKELGCNEAEKLKYYTSYEKGGGTGPCEYSVGYFSGILRKTD
ncbi:MAG: AmmeMemoRadiSam system protein B [Promethearchaeia archaeon]